MVQSINPEEFLLESAGNLGAVEVATFLSLALYGVSLSQGYTYFKRSKNDRFSLKLMGFFCLRIYRLSNKLPLTIAAFVLVLARFIGGLGQSVENFLDVPKKPFNGTAMVIRFSWLITSALTCGGAADILIAASMVYYLRRLASPTNLESTTQMLNRLIRFSLQTGILTSMTSLAVIACFQAMSNMIWFSLYIFLAKLYSNSLLVSLNARPRKDDKGRKRSPQSELVFEPRSFSGPYSVSFQITFSGDTSEKMLSPPPKVSWIQSLIFKIIHTKARA
ncbi:hypothetical protein CVT26_013958 [Gymnopilus dilepis]|uniref:DUF6534 domain-containing protein n=1 Tax=Gymnopilus dilepis TaxID=231916 RepID=A0A409WDR1_9AGAR|nr:hypothetical protein CVT26_013958 [Gymnopilus dilepis]